MTKVKYLIVGAGISGLSFASQTSDYLIIEKDSEVGGLCKTIKRNGYIWDYSGHFFHFKESDLKAQFIDQMPKDTIINKEKNTKIYRKDLLIDFPFQKNIHQLDKSDFIECLYDLYFKKEQNEYASFKQMLYGKFGEGITEMFLKPYNEKLYACDLDKLEVDAMGRFFPYANIDEIIRNMKQQNNQSYNDTFLYPKNGAVSFVDILMSKLDTERVWLNCELVGVDMDNHIAMTTKGDIEYEYMINTSPLNNFCRILNIPYENTLSSNKVLVFNMGFDKKSQYTDIHWMYFPEKKYNFYRVGFYDNILNQDKLSIYVEIGFPQDEEVNTDRELNDTLTGLKECGIISDHKLIDYCSIIMNPAYVHINEQSETFKRDVFDMFNKNGIYSIGRYGKWTYCSIEDCVLDAFNLLDILG
jgi:protoporphyrinogen oxidase